MRKAIGSTALLGDTSTRNYASKLQRFNAFAQRELRGAIASLELNPRMRVLDAGCGTGEALGWFADEVGAKGVVVGMDLAAAHAAAARSAAPPGALVLQADVLKAPLANATFDLVWCVNTINHFRDPLVAANLLASLLRPGGRLALGQSSFLPDMYFAWDSRLERLANEAVRQYYKDRYGLDERDLATTRGLVGPLHRTGLRNVTPHTFVIERTSPLSPADERYLFEAIFRDTWGERLRAYLREADYVELARLCDPAQPGFALRRADFHFLQTFTLVVAES
jgi:SAM-dependent methyltransferase